MTIRVVRNEAGNCVNFYGTSNPTYWNACLTAEEDATYADHINIRNDIQTAQSGEIVYEFYQLPFDQFVRADNTAFADVNEAVAYITAAANVLGNVPTLRIEPPQILAFTKTADGTTILVDNGDTYGLGSIHANKEADGTITIHDHTGNKNLYINGSVLTFTIGGNNLDLDTDVAVNELNAYFHGTALGGGGTGHQQTTITVNGVDHQVTAFFIESPDGAFTYPIFDNADDAELVNEYLSGSTNPPTVFARVWVDEPTGAIWYIPAQGAHEGVAGAPTSGSPFIYNEIPTNDDSLYTPPALTQADVSFAEETVVNLQITPAGVSYTTNVSLLPAGLTYAGGAIVGTTRHVPYDTTYPITVERINSYGTSTTTFNLTITNDLAGGTIPGWTTRTPHSIQTQPDIILEYSPNAVYDWDTPLSPGTEISWTQGDNDPVTSGPGTFMQMGIVSAGVDKATTDLSGSASWDLKAIFWDNQLNNNPFGATGWPFNGETYFGSNNNVEWKLRYTADGGPLELYRNGALVRTSADNYTGDITLTVFIPAAYGRNTRLPGFVKTLIGAGSTTPPTGFVDPLVHGEMYSTEVLGNDRGSVAQFIQTLKVNHRFIVPKHWIETNIFPYYNSTQDKVFIGVPKSNPGWNQIQGEDFEVMVRLQKGGGDSHKSWLYASGSNSQEVTISSATDAHYSYAIEWDGEDLHIIADTHNNLLNQPAVSRGGTFARVISETGFTAQSGALPVAVAVNSEAQCKLTTTGIQLVRIPLQTTDVIVGENSNGSGDLKVNPTAADYDSTGSHAPAHFTYDDLTALQAGSTYRFIYHPSMEADDLFEFRLASDSTTVYTTGVTAFDNSLTGDPRIGDAEGYKGLIFTVPADAPPLKAYFKNNIYYDNGRPVTINGSSYVAPITGITFLGPTASFSGNTIADSAWFKFDETISAGERLILPGAFLHDIASEMQDGDEWYLGLKSTNTFAPWTENAIFGNGFEGITYVRINRSGALYYLELRGGVSTSYQVASLAQVADYNMFFEVVADGNEFRVGRHQPANGFDDIEATAYEDWMGATKSAGNFGWGITEVEVVMWYGTNSGTPNFNTDNVDWTVPYEVATPVASLLPTTSFAKAIDFNGGSERCKKNQNGNTYSPLRMGGISTTVGPSITTNVTNTVFVTDGRPWATSVVFRHNGHSSNQHIWNQGEGGGTNQDDIFLRVDAQGDLFFGWGRSGSMNQIFLGNIPADTWTGLYIGTTGERVGGTGATAAELKRIFQIYTVNLTTGVTSADLSTQAAWEHAKSSTGGRMDYGVGGLFCVGGRDSNDTFKGKVASMVTWALPLDTAMPSAQEASMMTRDPIQWMADYRVGESYRTAAYATTYTNLQLNTTHAAQAIQVWLMGDGTNDAYPTIYNQSNPSNSNSTLAMTSMVSNDIETVSIPGLS